MQRVRLVVKNIHHTEDIIFKLPPKFLCPLFKHSFHSNPSLVVDVMHLFYFPLFCLNSLSCALQKHPKETLQRSQSLCDLTTLGLDKNSLVVEKDTSRHHSCPNLLEMDSLHSMHPQVHKAIGSDRFYYTRNKTSNSNCDTILCDILHRRNDNKVAWNPHPCITHTWY